MTRPIKCRNFDPSRQDFRRWRFAQLKQDGMWLTVHKDRFGRVCTKTRKTEHDLKFVPTLKSAWGDLPPDSEIYGELYAPCRPASAVISAIKDRDGDILLFEAFAIARWRGEDFPITTGLDEVTKTLSLRGFKTPPFVYTDVGDWVRVATWAANARAEGLVLKNGNMHDWAKWKPVRTIDAVVVDTKDGNGKYVGELGALVVGVYDDRGTLREIARVSGMTDEERVDMSLVSPIGRVVEVEYQYVGAGGRLRHPRFVRFRDSEKTALECTTEQEADLCRSL